MRQEFKRLTMGSTHQTIYVPDAHAISVPLPPLGEQDVIVSYLQGEIARARDAICALERQLDLLAEYRQALVTGAVTGQIDVSKGAPDLEEVVV